MTVAPMIVGAVLLESLLARVRRFRHLSA